jgi:hypothetical protein
MAASVLPDFSWANVRTVGVEDCLAMSPAKMVDSSKVVQDALQYLQSTIETIGDAKVRKVVAGMIADPMPTFYAPLADGGNDDLRGKKFNAFRNYTFSQVTAMNLYHHYSATGRTGLAEKLTSMIVPA